MDHLSQQHELLSLLEGQRQRRHRHWQPAGEISSERRDIGQECAGEHFQHLLAGLRVRRRIRPNESERVGALCDGKQTPAGHPFRTGGGRTGRCGPRGDERPPAGKGRGTDPLCHRPAEPDRRTEEREGVRYEKNGYT